MSVAIEDPAIEDSYSAEIIAKARELSPELDDYIVSQSYLLEADQDTVTPLWLRNKLIIKIVQQLAERGVIIDFPIDDLCDAPALVQMAMYLRSKFDQDTLYQFFRDRTELSQDIQELMTNDTDCIEDIVGLCNHYMPLDEGWEFIAGTMSERPGMVHSDERFTAILTAVFNKIDRLGDPDPIEDDTRSKSEQYIAFIGARKQKITEVAKSIYAVTPVATEDLTIEDKVSATRVKLIDTMMEDFEKPLSRAKAVIAAANAESIAHVINSIRRKYAPRWDHCLTYWIDPARAEEIPNAPTFAIMVATMFVDAGGGSDAKAKVIDAFEGIVDGLGDRYEKIREMLDTALANIVVQEDVRKVANDAVK